jgi:hypothetical protein
MEEMTKIEAPSTKAIAKAAGIALVVALIVLFTAVLPAEYGIDPLKTGKALGLLGLAESNDNSKGRAVAVPVSAGVYTSQPRIYKVDSEDFDLRPNEGVEMKYHMVKGAGMVYGWKADGKLAFEFHGEPDQKPSKDYYESYELDDKVGKQESYGSFTAPSTGIHGWFWQNKGHTDVKFHLTTAGFYDSAKMLSGGPGDDVPVEDAK